ncbi:LysR family transcriptional regulator [Komagataeibacter rhaeticus]|nr:LysR family transcriptional regulator [Komagataeibacter rhaeticus]
MLSRLEADLGVQLIKRTTRALSPTEIGQVYYERVKVLLEERDALDASIRQTSGAPSGRLRITAPMSFGAVQLVPALLAFAEQYPGISLDVSFRTGWRTWLMRVSILPFVSGVCPIAALLSAGCAMPGSSLSPPRLTSRTVAYPSVRKNCRSIHASSTPISAHPTVGLSTMSHQDRTFRFP